MSKTKTLDKLNGLNPRRNLPAKYRGVETEALFLAEFQKEYFRLIKKRGIAFTEFELQGYGIADLIWISWSNKKGSTALKLKNSPDKLHGKKLTAFEFKIKDWRKGFSQSYRYSYFSNRSILVVPPSLLKSIEKYLYLFLEMNVGLWTFNIESKEIKEIIKAKFIEPKNQEAHIKAISRITSSL